MDIWTPPGASMPGAAVVPVTLGGVPDEVTGVVAEGGGEAGVDGFCEQEDAIHTN